MSRGGRGFPATGGIHEEEVLGKAYDARIIRWLWGWVHPHRRLVALSLLLFVCVSVVQLAQPYLIKVAIDNHMLTGNSEGLNLVAFFFLLTLAGEFLFRFLEIYVLQKTGQEVVYDMRTTVFARLQRLPAAFFDRNPVGRLVTRVTTDVESLNEVFASGVVTVLGDFVKLAGIIIVMLWMNTRLALVTFTVVPVMLGLSLFFRLRLRDAYRRLRLRLARINAFLHESIRGMALVQLFRRQRSNYDEFENLNRSHRDADIGSVTYDSLFSAVVEWVGTLSVALIIWYGGGQILTGAISFGVLVAFVEYTQRFFVPIRELSTKYTVMQAAMASSERLMALLQEEPEPAALPLDGAAPAAASGREAAATTSDPAPSVVAGVPSGPGRGSVEFEDVWFQYVQGEEVLRGLSFRVEPGEKVAIVGFTGAGKSTLIKLLVRLYEPTSGRILLDGVDIRHEEPRRLRRRLGVVLQDSFLFQGSVAANISLDDPAVGTEQIVAASRAVQAHAFIERFPDGYDHLIRQRGSNISMGQKQLLAFARALAFDPEVLVLDEATSSVDPLTESRIQQAMDQVTRDRTSLIIAHRLSTVTRADRILVLQHGAVRESGSHRELMEQGGLYSRLRRLQMRNPADWERTG